MIRGHLNLHPISTMLTDVTRFERKINISRMP